MMFSAPYPILSGGPKVAWAPLLIAALTLYNYDSIDPKLRVKNTPTKKIHPEYDFIIVGAGSAGSVLAYRLSEVNEWSVLLLEAGRDETAITDVPFLAQELYNTKFDWQFKTEPSNTACLAQPDARCAWPRGKVLGGSSTINGMLYNRGSKKDYDHWESLGNTGWSYDDVLPYFLKSEDIQIRELRHSPYHSKEGPLTVSYSPYKSPLADAFFEAWEELGYPIIDDYNGEFQTGFSKPQFTIRDGHRCSTARAFLRPVRKRQNLDIAMHCYVTNVLINPNTKVAYGVEFQRNGTNYIVKARKEVIISAGALQSPQLLMLSGVGPKKHLEKISIPLLQDLKVGYNLHDHVRFFDLRFLTNGTLTSSDERLDIANAVLEYAKSGTWVLTFAHQDAIGKVHTRYANSSDPPDVQIVMFGIVNVNTCNMDAGVQKQLRNSTEHQGTCRKNATNSSTSHTQDAWDISVIILCPKSRGRVKLRSNNPFDYPIFIHNYLTKVIDLKTLVEGIQIALRMGNTSAMQRFGSKLNYTNPNCTHVPLYSDAYWECAIRYNADTVYHPVGTCKMGPYWDPEAVVDPHLRVYGIERLRVIDASIMPTIPNANTNAAAIMIGEKGADLVKGRWLRDHVTVN